MLEGDRAGARRKSSILRLLCLLILTCGVAIVARPLRAQQPVVTSARIRMITAPAQIWWVTISNTSRARMVNAHATLFSSTSVSWDWSADFAPSGGGPIGPGDSRRERVAAVSGAAPAPTLTLAVYDDGSVEGNPPAIAEYMRGQRALAAELGYWNAALSSLPSSDADLLPYLRARILGRADGATSIRSTLQGFVNETVQRPRGWYRSVAVRMRDDARAQLAFANRTLAAGAVRQTMSATVSVAPGTDVEAYVEIENLRDVALEAWGYGLADPATSKLAMSLVSSDACVSLVEDDASGRSGRIAPHATRRQRFFPGDHAPAGQVAALSHAIWVDLSSEGSSAEVAEVFHGRELEAASYAFWISELQRVGNLPVADAIAQLRASREKRLRTVDRESDLMGSNLERWARDTVSLSAAASSEFGHTAETLTVQQARLVRHLIKR
jgi:hypothetical protein